MSVSLDNVVRVSVTGPSRGLSSVNTSALAIITHEQTPNQNYGAGKVYLDAQGVAQDFGSNSETYKLANAVFSQSSNVLKGGGHVVVIPRLAAVGASQATILSADNVDLTTLSAEDYVIRAWVDAAASGAQDLTIGKIDRSDIGTVTASLNAQVVQAAGFSFSITGEMTSASIKVSSDSAGVNSRISVAPAGIDGSDLAGALKLEARIPAEGLEAHGADAGLERIKDTILRTVGKVPYFGVVYTQKMASDAELLETADTVQSLNIIQFVASSLPEDVSGVFKSVKESGHTKTRCLFYSTEGSEFVFAAGYASILLSMDFHTAGSALTMNLKDFVGLTADEGIDDDFLTKARETGVDVLADIGISKVLSHGGNQYADQVYSRLALKVDLQIAGINYLAQTNTKIPQTEEGMTGLKGAYRRVLGRYVSAGVFAPGEWTDSTTFGASPDDHRRNIAERGYFIYSLPVAQQATSRREGRVAPVVRIAAKEAGAIHSSNAVVLGTP